jgi:ribosomal protein S18 acetylase RimI-like enzyme
MGGHVIRPVTYDDLGAVADVWYRCEIEATSPLDRLPKPLSQPHFHHVLSSGEMYVAVLDGAVVGFSGSLVRGRVRFLTDLFVRPDRQGRGLGGALLQRAMPVDGLIHATLSSQDPRAQGLYLQAGMVPRWSHFVLRSTGDAATSRLVSGGREGVTVVPAETLAGWIEADFEASGRPRRLDLANWVRTREAWPLWFERVGRRLGYGLVQGVTPHSLLFPRGAHVGPIGVEDPGDLASCAVAAVRFASERLHPEAVFLGVPGPSPVLGRFVEAGAHIEWVDLFMASAEFLDPTRYLSSGSDLL